MQLIKKTFIEQELLEDVKCDMCGKSCHDSAFQNYEFAVLSAAWGYSTKYDGQKWCAELCASCADKVRILINNVASITGATGVRIEFY